MNAALFRSSTLFIWSRNKLTLPFLAAVYTAAFLISILNLGNPATLFALLLFFPLIFPLTVFVTAGNSATLDLLSPRGYFPKYFFSLPAAAWQLVLPFMLYATLLAAIQWVLAIVLTSDRTLGVRAEQMWLPFLATSFVPWAQAVAWTPLRRKATRVAQWAALLALYITAFACVLNDTLSSDAVIALSLVQFPIAYAVAVRGVARSRCGEPAPHVKAPRPAGAKQSVPSFVVPAFTSPQQAIFWIERRMHRWSGKSALIAVLPAVLIVVLILARLLGGEDEVPEGVRTLGRATIAVLSVSLLMVGIATGLNFASFRTQSSAYYAEAFHIPPYFAALPLTTGDFAWAKIKAAIANMSWVSLGVLLACGVVAHVSGLADTWAGQYEQWRAEYGVAGMLLLAALRPALLVLLVVSVTINVMWMALRGPGWGRRLAIASILFTVLALGSSIGGRRILEIVQGWLPDGLWLLAALKVCALAFLVARVRSLRLLSWPRLAALIGLWVATVGAIVGFCAAYLPDGAVAPSTALWAAMVIAPVLGAVGAPLALARNRGG